MKNFKFISVVKLGVGNEAGKARVENIGGETIDQALKNWRDGNAMDGFKETDLDLISITAI